MIVLDTNVISELMRREPDPRVMSWIAEQPMAGVFTTTLTQAEIFYGLALLPEGRRRDDLLAAARPMFEVDLAGRVLPFDTDAAGAYPEIAAGRKQGGKPISQIDAQIADVQQEIATISGSPPREPVPPLQRLVSLPRMAVPSVLLRPDVPAEAAALQNLIKGKLHHQLNDEGFVSVRALLLSSHSPFLHINTPSLSLSAKHTVLHGDAQIRLPDAPAESRPYDSTGHMRSYRAASQPAAQRRREAPAEGAQAPRQAQQRREGNSQGNSQGNPEGNPERNPEGNPEGNP